MKINLKPFPELTTARLVLRRLTLHDRYELMHLRNDPEVNKYLGRPKSMTMDEATAHVEKIDKILEQQQGVYWVISLTGERELIGAICFWNFDLEKGIVELGYELSTIHQRKGLMQEAMHKVIAYAFDTMEVNVITAVTHPQNEGSVKLLERNGFVADEGHLYVSEEDADGLMAYFLPRE